MIDDTAPSSSPIPDLLQSLEGLYQLLSNLTVKAKEKEDDIDEQVAIEETRTGILEEAGQILEEAHLLLLEDNADTGFDIDFFEKKRERIVFLIGDVQMLDKERALVCHGEKERLRQELHQASAGKQAAITYQKTP
jgi:hypothetical protein